MTQILNTPQTTGFMRLSQVLEVIPVSKSTWWAGVKTGRFPQPYKLDPGITVWRNDDIQAFIAKASQNEAA